jgi:peptide/nickel transport system permease protein
VATRDETAGSAPVAAAGEVRTRGPWSRAVRRFGRRPLAVSALAILLVIFGAGALAGHVAPYSYTQIHLDAINLSPRLTGYHFFGTDQIGRDYFSRTLYAVRTSAEVGLSVAILGTLVGVVVGGLAGYYGGTVDAALMRVVDFVSTIPGLGVLFAAIVLVGVPTPRRVAEVLILYLWTAVARVVRGSFFALRETEYVEAARAAGASDARILVRHLLPNSAGAIVVAGSLLVGQAILLETTIEFFDYGINQNVRPSLGNLIADATHYSGLLTNWWLYAMPAIVLVVMLVCVNFVGDSLDEALNPAAER